MTNTAFAEDEDKRTEAEIAEDEVEFDAIMARLATQGINVTWLSCDSDGDIDAEASGGTNPSLSEITAELAGLSHERTAAFEVGDMVVTLNPYTGDILMFEGENDDMPQYFEILDVKWDGEDNTFRYLLSGQDRWCAEGWIDVPDLPIMMRKWVPFDIPTESETSAMAARIDELTTEYISSTYLDMMNSGDETVRAKGLAGLKAMAAEGVI
jgi:hypothetical protein